MSLLTQNVIADLSTTHFVLVYSALGALAALGCVAQRRRLDATAPEATLTLPEQPDPLMVAALRGGEVAILEVLAEDLMARGYLHISAEELATGITRTVSQAPDAPPTRYLSASERLVFEAAHTPMALSALAKLTALPDQLAIACADTRQQLERERLVLRVETQRRVLTTRTLALALLAGLGTYRLMLDASRERPILAIALLLIITFLIGAPRLNPSPLTKRGAATLAAYQRDLGAMRHTLRGHADMLAQHARLLVAAFGPHALRGTTLDRDAPPR